MYNDLKYKQKTLYKLDKNGDGVATADFKVIVPARYEQVGLLKFGNEIEVLGLFAMRYEKNSYSLVSFPLMFKLAQTLIEKVTFNEKEYYELSIFKGDKFLQATHVVETGLVKTTMDEFIIRGNIPFYVSYGGLRKYLDRFTAMCGSPIANDKLIIDILVYLVSRNPKDPTKFYKDLPMKEINGEYSAGYNPMYIGLANVSLSLPNAFPQLTGNYFSEGLIAASLRDVNEVTELEEIIK